jgi:uncharacterized membrane protein
MQSFISPDNHFGVWAVLLGVCAFGLYGERKGWFRSMSGALVLIFSAAIFATINILPSATNPEVPVGAYNFVFDYIIPISIPLLIFNVNIKKIVRESGRLLAIFLIGSLGVVLGAVLAFYLIEIGEEAYKLAGVFIGTYTGGSVNFIAVGETLDFLESPLFSATIVVDNVFTNFFVMFLFTIPFFKFLQRYYPGYIELADKKSTPTESKIIKSDEKQIEKMAIVLTISSLICAIGFWLSNVLTNALNISVNIDLLIITGLIVLVANVFPKYLEKLERTAFNLGMLLMYIFLAVIGASCDLLEMLTVAPSVLFFCMITLVVHFIVIMIGGKLLKISLKEIAVASAANIGGPSIAAPIAGTLNMKKAITPAILIGVLGYVIGTFLGASVGFWLA